jgi:hypothetical protein
MASAVEMGLILRREGQGARFRAGQAMSDHERFGPVAPAPCPSRTAVPIGQRSATRVIACSGPGCPGPTTRALYGLETEVGKVAEQSEVG